MLLSAFEGRGRGMASGVDQIVAVELSGCLL